MRGGGGLSGGSRPCVYSQNSQKSTSLVLSYVYIVTTSLVLHELQLQVFFVERKRGRESRPNDHLQAAQESGYSE